MNIKKALCAVMAIIICLGLCGCDLLATNTDELLGPPQLTGDMYPIQQAINKSAGNSYTLKYPSAGDRRSAVILEDIESDGVFEAFAFYSTSEDELTNMHINAIRSKGQGVWESVAEHTIVAGGVDRVDFCDLDNDGSKEILVGWEIYGSSEKQLAIYSFDNKSLSLRLLQQYTSFIHCDLDGNGENEVFVQLLDTAKSSNVAALLRITDSGVSRIAGCIMDGSVKTAEEPVLSSLSSGQPAIYIDEIKGIGAITEVLYFSKGNLVNNLLDSANSLENSLTLRASSLSCTDINSDGILEIPVASDLPAAYSSAGEKLFYTNWCSFNGEKLSVKLVTIVNTLDRYYLIVPNAWLGKIAVFKDTEHRVRTIYEYDAENDSIGNRIVEFRATDQNKYEDDDERNANTIEISRSENTVFTATLFPSNSKLSVTADDIKNIFRLSDE